MLAKKLNNLLKNSLRSAFSTCGYRILKEENDPRDVFAVQRKLVSTLTPVIFDVGANIGEVCVRYRSLFQGCKIHCFEPFPDSYDRLEAATKWDPATECHQLALSDRVGIHPMTVNASAATNSLLRTADSASVFWGKGELETSRYVEVPVTTVDQFCAGREIGHLDILKIDVQGSEYAVLEGARGMIANRSIGLVYIELILCPTYEGQKPLHDYLSLLDECDFFLFDIFNPVRRQGRLIQVDAIFLPK